MERDRIMAKCTHCGAELPIEYLEFLPETDDFFRKLPSTDVPEGVDSTILLCPNCLTDWMREHGHEV